MLYTVTLEVLVVGRCIILCLNTVNTSCANCWTFNCQTTISNCRLELSCFVYRQMVGLQTAGPPWGYFCPPIV